MTTLSDVRSLLESDFHQKLLTNTLKNIRERLVPSGFFLESLTGAYKGMYSRTVGGLASVLTEIGEVHLVERPVMYILRSMRESGLELTPHVLGESEGGGPIPVLDDLAQVDGDAHLILAWALLHQFGQRDLSETWPQVAELLDRITRSPFLCELTRWRIEPGLVLNTHLEHSREHQYWHAYDFLTQSFVASALERMIPIAEVRGDAARAELWRHRYAFLCKQIAGEMIYERDGKKMYAEMLLPTGRTPLRFDGCGWLNLAPLPSGWSGVDQEVLENTVEFWRTNAALEWDGPVIPACDWTPEGPSHETYGKMVGWDFLAAVKSGNYSHAAKCLEFQQATNKDAFYAEIYRFDKTQNQWRTVDAGNGEQVTWLCWSMISARKIAGLPPLPIT